MPPVLGGTFMAVLPASPQQAAAQGGPETSGSSSATPPSATATVQHLFQTAHKHHQQTQHHHVAVTAGAAVSQKLQPLGVYSAGVLSSGTAQLFQPYSSISSGVGKASHQLQGFPQRSSHSVAYVASLAAPAAAQMQNHPIHRFLGPTSVGAYKPRSETSSNSATSTKIERKEVEILDLESRERDTKLERDRIEKQRTQQALVHQHFEESFRLAHQKRQQQAQQQQQNHKAASIAAWNNSITLPRTPNSTRSLHHSHQPSSPQTSSSHTSVSILEREEYENLREREHHLAVVKGREHMATNEFVPQKNLAYLRAATVPQTALQKFSSIETSRRKEKNSLEYSIVILSIQRCQNHL